MTTLRTIRCMKDSVWCRERQKGARTLHRCYLPRRSQGFTLVELLIVIAILAILVALLLPGLQRARKESKYVQCMNNPRQLTMAFTNCTTDNNGAYPHFWWYDYSRVWFTMLMPYYGNDVKLLLCPETQIAWTDWNVPIPCDHAWDAYGCHGSYAFNMWVTDYWNTCMWALGTPMDLDSLYLKLSSTPVDTPILCDGYWVDLFPLHTDPYPPGLTAWNFSRSVPGWQGLSRVCMDRHSESIAVARIDGSGQRVKTSNLDLWSLNWGKSY